MSVRHAVIAVGFLGGLCVVTILAVSALHRHELRQSASSAPTTIPKLVNQVALAALPTKNASSADLSHLGSGIAPPTNSWLSGLALQKVPLAAYPMPLSFLAKDTSFEVGLPKVSSMAAAITGPHTPGIQGAINHATTYKLTRYDKVSATLTYYNANSPLATVTLAEGSPYIFYQAATDTEVTFSGVPAHTPKAGYFRYSQNGHDYVVVAGKGATLSQFGSNLQVHAKKGSLVTIYALPSATASDSLRVMAGNVLQSVEVTYGQTAKTSTTSFKYKTANGKPTVLAAMSYQQVVRAPASITTYDSTYGLMQAFTGNSYTITAPAVAPSDSLNLAKLSAAQKAQLISQLPADVSTTVIDQADSYFAGKQLARAANLLDIAEQLHQTAAATQLKGILNEAFNKRLGTDYFYYDSQLKGIAASTKAFGSEDFNDHHFHYGYFLYAASLLGKYDSSFVTAHKDQVNLLAADIASYKTGDGFPLERNYDPYAGHSWAAGLAPFSDGNNQESSSEAINAWNGVSLWGQLTGNQALSRSGQWMLASESSTAQSAWRNVNTKPTSLSGYTSPLVDINFGGKRVYSTFFSDAASAKLGIQLIPLNPAMTSFKTDGPAINRLVNSAIQGNNFNVSLGDYVLMYYALANPVAAAQLAPKQQDAFIDNGNSRTYMDAWIFAQNQ
jgi:endo-1,3(4)-beta-glucanase